MMLLAVANFAHYRWLAYSRDLTTPDTSHCMQVAKQSEFIDDGEIKDERREWQRHERQPVFCIDHCK